MLVLFDLGSAVVGALFQSIFEGIVGRGKSRSRAKKGTFRCDLRAIEGRVYNMGTEWSSGQATITAGHIMFEPSMGIVGKREIDVDVAATVQLARSREDAMDPNVTIVEIVTPKGHLEWLLDTKQLVAAAELLAGQPAVS